MGFVFDVYLDKTKKAKGLYPIKKHSGIIIKYKLHAPGVYDVFLETPFDLRFEREGVRNYLNNHLKIINTFMTGEKKAHKLYEDEKSGYWMGYFTYFGEISKNTIPKTYKRNKKRIYSN